MNDVIIDSDDPDDISLIPTGKYKETGELDLNDELQNIQDLTCYNLYKRKLKRGRKTKEWREDILREDDITQI